jgi:hypothetical protein
VKKVVECAEMLRLRAEELSLPAFARRVVDCHPWVKQRMQRMAAESKTQGPGNGGPQGQGTHAGGGAQSVAMQCGDLGAALVAEAEAFDAAFDLGDRHEAVEGASNCNSNGGGASSSLSAASPLPWGPGGRGAAQADNDAIIEDYEDEAYGEHLPDPAVAKRLAKVNAFLDHLLEAVRTLSSKR